MIASGVNQTLVLPPSLRKVETLQGIGRLRPNGVNMTKLEKLYGRPRLRCDPVSMPMSRRTPRTAHWL